MLTFLTRTPQQKNWDSIVYCSDSCRSNKVRLGSLDESFESAIMRLLTEKDESGRLKRGVVTCEEVERVVLEGYGEKGRAQGATEGDGEADGSDGTPRMGVSTNDSGAKSTESTTADPESSAKAKAAPSRTRERSRQAARRLVAKGKIVITQEGKEVDPSFAKGVLELKLVT